MIKVGLLTLDDGIKVTVSSSTAKAVNDLLANTSKKSATRLYNELKKDKTSFERVVSIAKA